MRTLALLAALSTPLAAQITFTLPSPPPTNTNNLPFAIGPIRYQQWFSASQLTSAMGGPMRLTQVQFLAGAGTQVSTTLDMELAISHGSAFGLTGTFDSNFATPRTVVMARRSVTLPTATAGTAALTFQFSQAYTWNGVDPVLLEIRVYGNGNGNQPFNYNFEATTGSTLGMVSRAYAVGNPNALTGTAQSDWGLYATFDARPGFNVPFGQGCPGEGNFVPVATTQQLAWPGITWTQQVSMAASQRLALWTLGNSRTSISGQPLPLDLGPFANAPGCFLYDNSIASVFTTTVGGGAGGGIGTVTMSLPAIPSLIGVVVYSQWLIADPLASNGVLSASNAMWHKVAPVGG
jgi:hypothetical protein